MINKPELEWLTVGLLQVDGYAQRKYKEKQAKEIADKWNPRKLGVFKVSRRDSGGSYLIDGQHRRGAMLMLDKGEERVPALVYEGLTIDEEAELFLADNADNRPPTSIDIYLVSLTAKDPLALAIQEVLDKHQLKVGYGSDGGSVGAVASLKWLHEQGGTDLIDQTLSLVESAWGERNRDARDGQILKGIGKVLKDHTGARLDLVSLAHKLGSNGTPSQLLGTARTLRGATGKALWLQVADVAVTIYNKGKTSQRVGLL